MMDVFLDEAIVLAGKNGQRAQCSSMIIPFVGERHRAEHRYKSDRSDSAGRIFNQRPTQRQKAHGRQQRRKESPESPNR